MIRRVVMLWLKDCSPQRRQEVTAALRAMMGRVPGLLSQEVSIEASGAEGACHICAVMLFLSQAALDAYLAHPLLEETLARIRDVYDYMRTANYPLQTPARHMPRLYAFVGPANRDAETLGRLLDEGMRGIRIRLQHHSVEEALPIVEAFRHHADLRGIPGEVVLHAEPGQTMQAEVRALRADALAISLPGSIEALRDWRALLPANVRLLGKIETLDDLHHLPSYLPYLDEVIIARNEMHGGFTRINIPTAQQHIAEICLGAGVPFMIATDLLPTMRTKPFPTSAEVNDVYNAVRAGAQALALSQEISTGNYPVQAMATLRKAAEAALTPTLP